MPIFLLQREVEFRKYRVRSRDEYEVWDPYPDEGRKSIFCDLKDAANIYPSDFDPPLHPLELENIGKPGAEDENLAKHSNTNKAARGVLIGKNENSVYLAQRPLGEWENEGPGFVQQASRLGKLIFTGPSGTSQVNHSSTLDLLFFLTFFTHFRFLPTEPHS